MYRRILGTEKWRWYAPDVFMPLLAGTFVAGALAVLWNSESSNFADITLLTLAAVITLAATLFGAPTLRQLLQQTVKSAFEKWKIAYGH